MYHIISLLIWELKKQNKQTNKIQIYDIETKLTEAKVGGVGGQGNKR